MAYHDYIDFSIFRTRSSKIYAFQLYAISFFIEWYEKVLGWKPVFRYSRIWKSITPLANEIIYLKIIQFLMLNFYELFLPVKYWGKYTLSIGCIEWVFTTYICPHRSKWRLKQLKYYLVSTLTGASLLYATIDNIE